ncbi:hypothetical protein FBZ83_11716 [Azospirillum brasilense]|uniref:PAS domain-containing protein n=1 Tax=Azospirillum brasilense TaxID=192 RepID=A0A560BW84_AZOBR|nr:hypothetical protein [Azospirillum brasilense]TWA76875.1 hypothetical protein FBZ83_11716 [Azospirillum brasilense]
MSVISFPNQDRGARRPASSKDVTIERRPIHAAADWQSWIVNECRTQKTLSPSIFSFLKGTGLLVRCTFLASDGPNSPLLFRYIGAPTVEFLGRAWARQQIGKPDLDDPHHAITEGIGPQYREAIEGGEPLFNQVTITGLSADQKVYTHALYGWQDSGRRAVLSCLAA